MSEVNPGGNTATRIAERSGGGAMLFALGLASALGTLMVVCLFPEIVTLATQFKQPVSSVAWAMIITSIVGTGVGAVAAGLGAIIGNRLMLIVLVTGVLVGGVVVALSQSLTFLIIGRGIQGLGVGSITLCIGIVATFWSGQKMRRAIGTLVACSGIGAVAGYMLGGFIWKGGGDWHTMFWVVVGLAALALVLILAFVKETKRMKGVPIDFVGVVGLLAWAVLILLPLSQANSWGWGSSKVLELLIPGLVVLVLWVLWELRRSAPLLDLRILVRMGVWQGALLYFAAGIALYMTSTSIPFLFQTPHALGGYGFGKDIFMVSLALSMPGLLMLLLSPTAATFMRAMGGKGTMLLGVVFCLLGGFGMAAAHGSVWMLFVWLGAFGITNGVGGAAANAVAAEAVSPQQGVVATTLLISTRNIAASFGTALAGYILTLRTGTFKVPGAPAPVTVPASQTFTWAFIVVGVVGALGVVAILTINAKKIHVADREA